MKLLKGTVEWHDLRSDPDDLPEEGDDILTTIEKLDGDRETRSDIYLKQLEDDRYCWCTTTMGPRSGVISIEETMFWLPVVAWAELPDAYVV